ncbi:MAG TPA: hypothetical protein VEG30_18100 [Terriglobales bacterium]|nr:hypothetical protein [Terriglobales bacterium]
MKRILLCLVALCAPLSIHAQMTVGYVPSAGLLTVSDSFIRANCSSNCGSGGALGSNWTLNGTTTVSLDNSTGVRFTDGSDSYQSADWTANTITLNQFSQVTLLGTDTMGVVVRETPNNVAYAKCQPPNGGCYLIVVVSGSQAYSSFYSATSGTPATVRLEAVGHTYTLKYCQGASCTPATIGSWTNSGSDLTTGQPGIYGNYSGTYVTNWSGGGL